LMEELIFLTSASNTINNYLLAATEKDQKYDHIEQSEKDKIIKEAKSFQQWLYEFRGKQDLLPKYKDPILKCEQILQKIQNLDNLAKPILNKPKPAPPKEEKKRNYSNSN